MGPVSMSVLIDAVSAPLGTMVLVVKLTLVWWDPVTMALVLWEVMVATNATVMKSSQGHTVKLVNADIAFIIYLKFAVVSGYLLNARLKGVRAHLEFLV